MYAAIGSDGTREVVWGIGASEAEANADARSEASQSDCDPELIRTVTVTAEQVERIRGGEVSASALGL